MIIVFFCKKLLFLVKTNQMSMETTRYISVNEFAKAMQCSPSLVYKALAEGTIKGEKLEGGFRKRVKWKIPEQEVAKFKRNTT